MKLKAPQNFVPVRERLELPGDLHAYLTGSAGYDQAMHGATSTLPELLGEGTRASLRSEREFGAWRRSPPTPTPPRARPAQGNQGDLSRSDS